MPQPHLHLCTNASAHFTLGMKALGTYKSLKVLRINLHLANRVCHCVGWFIHLALWWLWKGWGIDLLPSQVLLVRALCENGASLTVKFAVSC